MEKKLLTRSQKKVYDVITGYINLFGVAPTIKEISDELEKARSTIHEEVSILAKKGYITKMNNKKRGIIVINR